MLKILSKIACLFVLCSCSTITTTDNKSGIPNLKVVEAGIWRGGQPKTDADWQYLQSLGIKKVIKLDTDSEGSDERAKKFGMEVIKAPIDLTHQTILMPNDETIVTALLNIEPHTFIHCSHGQDRTGLIVGLYRWTVDAWSAKDAYSEMRRNGFHPELLGLYLYWEKSTL